ncbi:hypothetical protein BH20ACT2_BH20ACT2_00880 [soil metagenome]
MTSASSSSPLEVTREFVAAVAWGEHLKIWDLLGREARATVLRVAVNRGMDEALSARLRDGTATTGERDTFLADLVNGLRTDLAGADLDALDYDTDPGPEDPGRARVILTAPLPATLGLPGLPVGSVELTQDDGGGWLVDRLLPRNTR